MARMALRKARQKAEPDFMVRLPGGQVMVIEAKRVGSGIAVRDVLSQAILHVDGARAAAVGAASVFGWYVRSEAPWSSGDDVAIGKDWQAVGDDLWRAAGDITRATDQDEDQAQLFDPHEYSKAR